MRDNGDRYFNHLVSVSILGPMYLGIHDLDVIRAALRHDSPEMHMASLEEILRKDGARQSVRRSLVAQLQCIVELVVIVYKDREYGPEDLLA